VSETNTWTKISYKYMVELLMADHDARCPAGHHVDCNSDQFAYCFECKTSWPMRVTVEVDWTKGEVDKDAT